MENTRAIRASDLLERVHHERPDVWERCYIVGAWVWVEFDQKPDTSTRGYLKAAGFRFNSRRKCWQHPCGVYRRRSSSDPRMRYGVVRVAEEQE